MKYRYSAYYECDEEACDCHIEVPALSLSFDVSPKDLTPASIISAAEDYLGDILYLYEASGMSIPEDTEALSPTGYEQGVILTVDTGDTRKERKITMEMTFDDT